MCNERPMIFNDEMVRALLRGNKTLTRRPMKPQPMEYKGGLRDEGFWWPSKKHESMIHIEDFQDPSDRGIASDACPYGAIGDRIWVRETWQSVHFSYDCESGKYDDCYESEKILKEPDTFYETIYAADEKFLNSVEDRGFSWRPSIHMPRWASRITLEITDVRVERVRDISEEDAKAEGINRFEISGGDDSFVGWHWRDKLDLEKDVPWLDAKHAFMALWDRIYFDRDVGWGKNPFVWVIEFKKL